MISTESTPLSTVLELFQLENRARRYSPATIDFYQKRLLPFTAWCRGQGASTGCDTGLITKLHFAGHIAFAGDWQTALQPSTLARWRQSLYETGFTALDGSTQKYSVNSINQRLAAIRGVMTKAAQRRYIMRRSGATLDESVTTSRHSDTGR